MNNRRREGRCRFCGAPDANVICLYCEQLLEHNKIYELVDYMIRTFCFMHDLSREEVDLIRLTLKAYNEILRFRVEDVL